MTIVRRLPFAALLMIGLVVMMPARGVTQSTPNSEALQAAKDLLAMQAPGMSSDLIAAASAQIWPTIELSLRTRNPNINAVTMDDLRREFDRLQSSYLSELMNEVPNIYARYFTADELREIIAFYRTPTGSKALTVMPRAMAEFVGREIPRMQARHQQVIQAFTAILRARGLSL